jgi:DMSO/TMAO reductase YedYZ heme-binding membrane subunit
VAWTRSRPRGRENARPISGGPAAEHATKIYGTAITAVVAIVAFLALTSTGHVIDAATQRFMLFYAGVFALIALCGSVALGLIATDRMILHPGHRIFVQSAHRAASFGAVAFLIIHITTEILAQRVHVLDAFVPFLSPFRTFYIGLGTIASDLVLLLVITGIMRKRFTAHGKAWRWRAIHYTSYVAFVFGVWHGLLGGRAGKPYVDWSYGFVVAMVALGLAVRILANSLRPKETLSAPPVPESASSGSAPMRAASMFAQLGIVRAATSAAVVEPSAPSAMLAAPTDGWTASPMTGPTSAYAALPPGPYEVTDGRQPFYEPGYEGPPRYLGAPRESSTGPLPRAATGPLPRANSGPLPRASTGPLPRANSGALPRANSGPLPRANTGPLPRANTGPLPRANTGPLPRANSGALPRARTGPMPQVPGGPVPGGRRPAQRPGAASGPMPQVPGNAAIDRGTGPMPRANGGPMPRANSGPMPRANSGPMPRAGTGPMPRAQSGPMPRAASGPMPSAGGQRPRRGSPPPPGTRGGQPRDGQPRDGQMGAHRGGGQPAGRNGRGQARPAAPNWPEAQGWPEAPGWDGSPGWDNAPAWANTTGWDGAVGWSDATGGGDPEYGQPPWEGGTAGPDPGFRYREPGPGMPGYRGPSGRFRGGEDLR